MIPRLMRSIRKLMLMIKCLIRLYSVGNVDSVRLRNAELSTYMILALFCGNPCSSRRPLRLIIVLAHPTAAPVSHSVGEVDTVDCFSV